MAKLKMALCAGRHNIPEAVDGAIFAAEIQDVTDTNGLERMALNGLWDAAWMHHRNNEAGFLCVSPDWDGSDMEPLELCAGIRLDLYVTGLTVALIATVNVCKAEGVVVTLYHYDKETRKYFPQAVA